MASLKQLFTLKSVQPQQAVAQTPTTPTNNQTPTTLTNNQTYKQFGLVMAGACNGEASALDTQLSHVLTRIKNHQAQNLALQNQYKAEISKEIGGHQAEIGKQEDLIKIHQANISRIQGDIKELDDKKAYVKAHPEEYGTDPMSKIGLYVGGAILIFLTLYLFIFYSSASYSAFFKTFTAEDNNISQAIFDAQALSSAWNQGATALMLILLIPFVFLGLGFLIHKFQESKSISGYIKVGVLIVITFVFDYILAYEITEKIYNIKREGSFSELPEYSPSMAFSSVNFWLIIFSGFIVYLIWGFVFDITMESYKSLDNMQRELNSLRDKRSASEAEIKKEKDAITDAEREKAGLNAKIEDLKSKINNVFVNIVELKHELSNFFDGWLIFVSNHTGQDTQMHIDIYEAFKQKNNL